LKEPSNIPVTSPISTASTNADVDVRKQPFYREEHGTGATDDRARVCRDREYDVRSVRNLAVVRVDRLSFGVPVQALEEELLSSGSFIGERRDDVAPFLLDAGEPDRSGVIGMSCDIPVRSRMIDHVRVVVRARGVTDVDLVDDLILGRRYQEQ
jgi:hypothetical protein